MSAIKISGLHKTFNNSKRALRHIDLTVQRGEMVALIGASGSGKSTLIRHIGGLVAGDSGDIVVLGAPVASLVVGDVGRAVSRAIWARDAWAAAPRAALGRSGATQ